MSRVVAAPKPCSAKQSSAAITRRREFAGSICAHSWVSSSVVMSWPLRGRRPRPPPCTCKRLVDPPVGVVGVLEVHWRLVAVALRRHVVVLVAHLIALTGVGVLR